VRAVKELGVFWALINETAARLTPRRLQSAPVTQRPVVLMRLLHLEDSVRDAELVEHVIRQEWPGM